MLSQLLRRYSMETIVALACLLAIALGFLVRCHGGGRTSAREGQGAVTVASLVGALERADAFPPLKNVAVKSSYSIDTIVQDGASQTVAGARPALVKLRVDRAFVVVGWAVDSVARKAAAGAYVTIDGSREIPAIYGNARPDVSAALGYAADDCGFAALVPAGTLAPGRHVLGIAIVDAAQNALYHETSLVTVAVGGARR